MNLLHYKNCIYCDSSLVLRSNRPNCTSDNLLSTKKIFDSILKLELESPLVFKDRLETLQQEEYVFDQFLDYWRSKKVDPNADLICLHEETYFRDLPKDEPRLPMPAANIPFPDLAEVYIAEIMLGRELTPFEKDGRRWIPKIDQETGLDYLAPLTWIIYPKSYISMKDMVEKTDYSGEPSRKVFDIKVIRNRYLGRNGDILDG